MRRWKDGRNEDKSRKCGRRGGIGPPLRARASTIRAHSRATIRTVNFERFDRLPVKLFLAIAGTIAGLTLVTYLVFTWSFERGFVHAVAGEKMKGRFSDVRAYVAGPPPMVDASLRLLLREARLAPSDIRYDKFS